MGLARYVLVLSGKENIMATVNVDDFPQLSTLCWNRKSRVSEESETLQIYEAGWRFIDKNNLTTSERELINRLAVRHGNGVLNV
jgi:hypothetical protein